ncbi:MAG: hypothetical protein ACOYEB_09085 [Enterococcus lemanii]|jgi:hypothetical protein
MWIVNAVNAIDKATGRKASKFIVKNAGKIIGSGVKKASNMIGNPHLSEKVADVVDKGTELASAAFGSDNIVTKNISNAVNEMKGKSASWIPVENIQTNVPGNELINYNRSYDYNRNVGGTNFKRFRPSRRKAFKRVKVSKFRNKLPSKSTTPFMKKKRKLTF